MPAALPHRLRDESGMALVPVISLLAVMVMLGLALLALTDTQTREARAQRGADAAQALAEGVVAATAGALASNSTAADWPTSGSCQNVTGTLAQTTTASAATLEGRITTAVRDRFASSSADYDGAAFGTTWRVSVCPVAGTLVGGRIDQDGERRWDESFLTRTVPALSGRRPAQVALWVRAQARVARTGTGTLARARAVATKIRQGTAPFSVPLGYAVGTGSFSTEATTSVNNVASGQLLGSVLGTKPLIAPTSSKIGIRCGLLNTLNNPSSVCLSGTLSGVQGATNALGLSTLNGLLGVDRSLTLGTWAMAPADAQQGYRDAATLTKDTVAGGGSIATKSASGAPECFTEATDQNSIIYLGQVGDGNQYCTLSTARTFKILVVGRGGVRVTGPVTGVVYALNLQECGSDGVCSQSERTSAAVREVVRIEGNAGKVTGSVWADGAGGAVGIYPSLTSQSTAAPALLGGACSIPVLGPVLNVLGSTLAGVGQLLGQTLGLVAGVQEQVRYPGGASSLTGCQALTNQLGTLTDSQLLNLFATGGDVAVPVSERRTRTCKTWLVVCLEWNAWSSWTTKETQTVSLPALTSDVVGALTSVLTSYTAIQYDENVVKAASVGFTVGGGPVSGTYRNVAPN